MKAFPGEDRHLFVLSRGERLVATLTQALSEMGLRGGVISGLGALMETELGFYELHDKVYLRRTFADDAELISLTGNIALKDGKPFIHVHAALGDKDFGVFGGHLFEATVAVTCEVTVLSFPFAPERHPDLTVGLALIDRCGV